MSHMRKRALWPGINFSSVGSGGLHDGISVNCPRTLIEFTRIWSSLLSEAQLAGKIRLVNLFSKPKNFHSLQVLCEY